MKKENIKASKHKKEKYSNLDNYSLSGTVNEGLRAENSWTSINRNVNKITSLINKLYLLNIKKKEIDSAYIKIIDTLNEYKKNLESIKIYSPNWFDKYFQILDLYKNDDQDRKEIVNLFDSKKFTLNLTSQVKEINNNKILINTFLSSLVLLINIDAIMIFNKIELIKNTTLIFFNYNITNSSAWILSLNLSTEELENYEEINYRIYNHETNKKIEKIISNQVDIANSNLSKYNKKKKYYIK